jgi:hypothetical protein
MRAGGVGSCLAAYCQQGGAPITTTSVRLKELDGGAFGVTVLCTKGAGEYGRLATAASGLLCPMRRSRARRRPRAQVTVDSPGPPSAYGERRRCQHLHQRCASAVGSGAKAPCARHTPSFAAERCIIGCLQKRPPSSTFGSPRPSFQKLSSIAYCSSGVRQVRCAECCTKHTLFLCPSSTPHAPVSVVTTGNQQRWGAV